MLRRYEILMLAVPEITQDESKKLETELDKMVIAAKGSTISFERWGKFKLAYPVQKNEYGVYFLARFEVEEGSKLIDAVKSFFAIKVNDIIMRYIIERLDLNRPLTYQRPRSLEEAPSSSDVSAFLKENKMEGMLASAERDAR